MSEQTKSDQSKTTADEAPQVETAPVADADLENISGGSVISGGGGYQSAKPS